MKGLLSITFDDGLRCHFEQALPILDAYGLTATFFVVANTDSVLKDGFRHPRWKKTKWSKEDTRLFREMARRGHEFGSHSVHHRQPFLDRDPDFEAEISKKWIEDRLGIEVPSYCYPFCHYSDAIRDSVIRAGYRQARWGAHETYYDFEKNMDRFKIDCRLISKFAYERVRGNFVGQFGSEDVQGWVRESSWHVLMYHGIGNVKDGWWPIPLAEFERQMAELSKLRDAGAVEVITFGEGAERINHADERRS